MHREWPGARTDKSADGGGAATLVVDDIDGSTPVRVLRFSGELDVAVAPDLLPRVPDLVSGAPGMVLDLTAVTFFDSAGVRLVDRLARECGRVGVPFAVAATPRTPPARVLDIVGFGPPLVRADLETAVAAVTP